MGESLFGTIRRALRKPTSTKPTAQVRLGNEFGKNAGKSRVVVAEAVGINASKETSTASIRNALSKFKDPAGNTVRRRNSDSSFVKAPSDKSIIFDGTLAGDSAVSSSKDKASARKRGPDKKTILGSGRVGRVSNEDDTKTKKRTILGGG